MKTTITLLAICFSFINQLKASELFLRVNRSGTHYATVSGQTIYNSTNVFRFFDLPSGSVFVQVFQQGSNVQVFSSTVTLGNNQRIVGEIDQNGNLIIVQTLNINVQNWYTSTSNEVFSTGGQIFNPQPIIDNSGFTLFLEDLKKESFDSRRQERALAYVTKANLSADQIGQILKTFSFDSYKVDVAKKAYERCFDKQNYFLWKSAFSFESNFREVTDYIEGL